MVDKLPPHDIDAEEATLGSLVLDGTAIRKICNQLSEADFTLSATVGFTRPVYHSTTGAKQ